MSSKIKIVRNQEIPEIPIKEATVARVATPFLRRVNSENIREEELSGLKSKFVKASPTVAGNSVTLDANEQAIIQISLTAHDGNVIIAWPQINIYMDVAGGNRNDLWFSGDNVSSTDATLQIGFTQQISTKERSDLLSNQARVEGEIVNRDAATHTYYVYVRWLYLIVE
jgi:hypothetical protein